MAFHCQSLGFERSMSYLFSRKWDSQDQERFHRKVGPTIHCNEGLSFCLSWKNPTKSWQNMNTMVEKYLIAKNYKT